RIERKLMGTRVHRDRLAVDELERDVRHAGVGDAAFDQARDAVMAQLRERLALAAETALILRRIDAATQELERDRLADAFLRALGAKDDRRAAFAELVDQRERPDAQARGKRDGVGFEIADADQKIVERLVEHARPAFL